jgi:hypothetical protein
MPPEDDDHAFLPTQPRQQDMRQAQTSSHRREDAAPLQTQQKHLQLQLQDAPQQDARGHHFKSTGLDEGAGDRDRARGVLYRNGSSTGLFRAATGAPALRPGTFTVQVNAKPLFGRSAGDQTGTSSRRTAQESGPAGKNPAASFLRFRRPSMGRHLGADDTEHVVGADDENWSAVVGNEDFKSPEGSMESTPARVAENTPPDAKDEPHQIRRQKSIRSRQRGLLSRFIEPHRQ